MVTYAVRLLGLCRDMVLAFILCRRISLDHEPICTHAIEVGRKREPQIRLLLVVDNVHILLLLPLLSLRRRWKIVE